MGNSPSNRKITVMNDDVAGVIKISDSVVRRLKGEIEQEKEREKKSSRQPVQQSQEGAESTKPSHYANSPPPPSQANTKKSKESNAYEQFMEDAHLTSLKIRQEKEAEIRRVQEHWRNQLLNLTDHYSKLAEQTEAEYRAAVEDVERSFAKENFNNVCADKKDCVLQCYKENKDKPLYCANQVKEFASCVQKFRLESLDR